MNKDLGEFLEFAKSAHCPRCGASQVAWVVFGLPSEEAIEDAQEDGDVVFGDCTLELDAQPFYCKGCQFEWGNEERQRFEEQRAQLSKEQQGKLWRLLFSKGLELQAERARRREENVIQYYRDRHARRHCRQSLAPQVFAVGNPEVLQ